MSGIVWRSPCVLKLWIKADSALRASLRKVQHVSQISQKAECHPNPVWTEEMLRRSPKLVRWSHPALMAVAGAGRVLEERLAVVLRRRPGSHSKAFIQSPMLCVRQIRVSISSPLCVCWLNSKRQQLQRPNGGEKVQVPKVFYSSMSNQTYSDVFPFCSWWICHTGGCFFFVPLSIL